MKKYFIILLSLIILTGCTQIVDLGNNEIPKHLKLKAPKEKILKSKEVDWIERKSDGSFINKGKIIKYDYITENQVEKKGRFKKGERYSNIREIRDGEIDFFVGDHYFKDNVGNVYEIEHGATSTIDAFDEYMQVSFFEKIFGRPALADDFYTGAGDGAIFNSGSVWNTVRNAGTGTTANPTLTSASIATMKPASIYYNYRGFFPTNTSAIPPGSIIISADFNFFIVSVDASGNNNIIQTSQADETTLVTSDYGAVAFTAGSGNFTPTAGQYNVIALNGIGLGWIKKSGEASNCGSNTGWTCIGVTSDKDISNTAPTNRYSDYYGWTSERTGNSEDPFLTVEFSEAPVVVIQRRKATNQESIY